MMTQKSEGVRGLIVGEQFTQDRIVDVQPSFVIPGSYSFPLIKALALNTRALIDSMEQDPLWERAGTPYADFDRVKFGRDKSFPLAYYVDVEESGGNPILVEVVNQALELPQHPMFKRKRLEGDDRYRWSHVRVGLDYQTPGVLSRISLVESISPRDSPPYKEGNPGSVMRLGLLVDVIPCLDGEPSQDVARSTREIFEDLRVRTNLV